ncbi:MAG: hypothetical protein OQJ84_04980 [Xanthomonadales bacterium]|nr:hypothetical protein [Xanthomonadales bacterium]
MNKTGHNRPGRAASWLLSWLAPVVIGFAYFAAYYPGFTNHDSQSIWLNAFQYVADPMVIPIMDWYAPALNLLRILALKSGLGVAGFHALFCLLTYGTWAALVATLLSRPWHRFYAHGLLLLPFIGANLAFQVPDTWLAIGFAWLIIALRLGVFTGSPRKHAWLVPSLYFFGSLLLLGSRQNALLVLPVLMAVPWLLNCHPSLAVRRACIAAPLTALIAVQAIAFTMPLREQHKADIYMAFETIGVWKSIVASRSAVELADLQPPRVFAALSQPPAYYLARWNPSDVDAIIWDLPEFADRSNFNEPVAGMIRKDFFRFVFRHPLHYARMKLSFARNGLGLSAPDALPVSSPPTDAWIDQLGIPLHHTPLFKPLTMRLLDHVYASQPLWAPLSAPLAWWMAAIVVYIWRYEQRRVTRFDAGWLTLIAAYYLTILLFAPIYLPRYVFPVWVVLGVGTIRLLLAPSPLPELTPSKADRDSIK